MESESDLEITEVEAPGEEPGMNLRRRTVNEGRPFRFYTYHDLTIIQEVEKFQPFNEKGKGASEIWKKIASAFNDQYLSEITPLRARRRFNLLLGDFRKEDFLSRYRSGTEEEKTEIKDKLASIASLISDKRAEEKTEKEERTKAIDKDKEAAEEIKNAAASTFKRKVEETEESPKTSLPKRSAEKGLIDLWQEKQNEDRKMQMEQLQKQSKEREEDREIRKEELQIEREKILLDRQRLEMDREKQALESKRQDERFELEKEERRMMLLTQQALLNLLNSTNANK